MTFTNTTPGMLSVTCNGGCGTVLEQTPENKGVNLLDFMRSAGWTVGSNVCPACKKGWGNAVELAPGVWTERPEPPQAATRRVRRRRKLL